MNEASVQDDRGFNVLWLRYLKSNILLLDKILNGFKFPNSNDQVNLFKSHLKFRTMQKVKSTYLSCYLLCNLINKFYEGIVFFTAYLYLGELLDNILALYVIFNPNSGLTLLLRVHLIRQVLIPFFRRVCLQPM